jgi:SAM-dependent methyltransferase
VRDLSWEAEFDAGFCFGNSFGYLDAEGTRGFLKAVSRALKPGARFLLDYGMAAECILPGLRDRERTQIGDILFLEENHYHVAESCVETTHTFLRDGKAQVQKGLHGVYTLREVRQFPREAGFEARDLLRSLDGEPLEIGPPLLLVVAENA